MAATGFAIFPLWIALLFGGGAGLPLSLPPLPEDPVLARVAPEECLVYTSWSGMAKPSAKSQNQTEQLLAEPEVRDMFVQIERAIMSGIDKHGPPQQAAMAREAVRWGKKLLTRPTAAFVSSLAIGPHGPDIRGGVVVNAGDDVEELKTTLEKCQSCLPQPPEKVDIGGVACYRLALGQGAPVITWGIKDKYFVIGVGDGSLDEILKRADGQAPEWLTKIRKQLPVERPATISFINVKKIVGQFGPMGGPKAQMVIEALGLGNVTTLAAVSGLDGEGFVSRMLVGIDGDPTGVLCLATGKPLGPQDLNSIPCDADFAVAGRLDLGKVMDRAIAIASKIEPKAGDEIERHMRELNEHLGIDLRKDVVDSLGDVWCAYNSPSEGGLLISGFTGVVQVKDYDKLSAAHARLLALAQSAIAQGGPQVELAGPNGPGFAPPPRPRPSIEHFRFAEQDIYFLSAPDFPLAPAWCLTHKEFIVAAFPQQIKAYLSRGSDFKSLATVTDVVEAFKGAEGPVSLSYVDGRRFLDYLYPLACVGVQMASRELAREGIDINVSMVPSAPTLYRHLRPSVTMVKRTDAGIETTSRGTIPGSSLVSNAPVLAGLILPAVQKARESARRMQSQNNMKQMALAMLNYESAMGSLPAAYVADKNTGKPLLSWRVTILPYIEQDGLYRQFHLDEPWDSEHNKKLLEMMPQVYRHPDSRAAPGMTNYLTVRGKDTVFPGKEGVKVSQITDGMSNTIMAVEVSDGKAVPWTKPDDFNYDEKNPAAGLGGLFPGGFNAMFCDGSVRFISNAIDAETLRNLFNRNDGQVIDTSKF
jgi:prepilin-type processing-associated H-X9-DG protein